MRQGAIFKAVLIVALLTVAISAQAVPLNGTPLSITYGNDSATFSVTNCTYTGGNCSGFQMVQDTGNFGVIIETSPTGGTIADVNHDLSYTLNVTGVNPYVNGLIAAITGSSDPSYNTATLSFTGGSVTATTDGSGITQFGKVTSLSLSADVQADAFTSGSYINTVKTDLLVPEPASFGLLAFGMGALVFTKRRRA